jgi:hypothetical protein
MVMPVKKIKAFRERILRYKGVGINEKYEGPVRALCADVTGFPEADIAFQADPLDFGEFLGNTPL